MAFCPLIKRDCNQLCVFYDNNEDRCLLAEYIRRSIRRMEYAEEKDAEETAQREELLSMLRSMLGIGGGSHYI